MRVLLFLSLFFLSSCGFKVTSLGSNLLSTPRIVSGYISPFIGSIADNNSLRLISKAYAATCADPVYAKLYSLQSDGTILENQPLASQLIEANAKYSFDMTALNLSQSGDKVEYLVRAEGCNGDVYQRPVTSIDENQDVDAKTTVVAQVINSNSLVSNSLNQVKRSDVKELINSISGNSVATALHSLSSDANVSNKFNQIFGASPSVILQAKPDVILSSPSAINELELAPFKLSTFHVDPHYSFAYQWKMDGVVKSSSAQWNYIPGANESGTHQVDVFVGKSDGNGQIDTTKPYYTKTLSINVNNNILPVAPNFSLNEAYPTPVSSNTVLVNIQTGVTLSHCSHFSHLAITDSNTIPGPMQFNIACTVSGTQSESVTFSSGDGAKTLYLWAIDNEGVISSPKTLSLV